MLHGIIHASELLTGVNIRAKDGRKLQETDLDRTEDGALVYSVKSGIPDKVVWAGPTSKLPKKFSRIKKTNLTNLKGERALMPGMVDCHTHLVFAGDRSDEFAARCAGASYEEIAARGGGIAATVSATRAATSRELEALCVARIREIASYGVRTIEIKSGYGLSFKDELKLLSVIQNINKKLVKLKLGNITLVSTFLGAHAFPKDMPRAEYFDELLNHMLPEVAARKLATICDVFIDDGYFTIEEGKRLLGRASQLGFKLKIHADELGRTDASALAAQLGALSADHLLKISDDAIRKLSTSQTVAVLLPGTAFYLKAPQAPARKLLEAGCAVALATDFNPGTCPCMSLPVIMTIAALYLGMSNTEIFAAVTYNAAKALGFQERKGTLEEGKDADFAILPFKRFEEMYYHFGWSARKE